MSSRGRVGANQEHSIRPIAALVSDRSPRSTVDSIIHEALGRCTLLHRPTVCFVFN